MLSSPSKPARILHGGSRAEMLRQVLLFLKESDSEGEPVVVLGRNPFEAVEQGTAKEEELYALLKIT